MSPHLFSSSLESPGLSLTLQRVLPFLYPSSTRCDVSAAGNLTGFFQALKWASAQTPSGKKYFKTFCNITFHLCEIYVWLIWKLKWKKNALIFIRDIWCEETDNGEGNEIWLFHFAQGRTEIKMEIFKMNQGNSSLNVIHIFSAEETYVEEESFWVLKLRFVSLDPLEPSSKNPVAESQSKHWSCNWKSAKMLLSSIIMEEYVFKWSRRQLKASSGC